MTELIGQLDTAKLQRALATRSRGRACRHHGLKFWAGEVERLRLAVRAAL